MDDLVKLDIRNFVCFIVTVSALRIDVKSEEIMFVMEM